MARSKKLTTPVTLFAAIEQKQHDALRRLAFEERRSIADITRDAIQEYISRNLRREDAENRRPKARVAG
jgi:hypothetical protein